MTVDWERGKKEAIIRDGVGPSLRKTKAIRVFARENACMCERASEGVKEWE
jgi:hypothetical protein